MNDQTEAIVIRDADNHMRDLNAALQQEVDRAEAERAAAVEKELNRDVR
jgi:hypothetical protein